MASCNRITLKGTCFTSEVWSTSFNMSDLTVGPGGSAVTDYTDLSVLADLIHDLADTMFSAAPFSELLSLDGRFDNVRVEAVVNNEVVQVAESLGAPRTGLQQSNKTPQDALVVSLLTGRPGRSYRGRMYLPAWRASINATGHVSTPTGGNVAAALATFLGGTGLAMSGYGTFVPVIHSRAKNEVTEVTTLRVGNVLDTQRRRRDAISEVYTTHVL